MHMLPRDADTKWGWFEWGGLLIALIVSFVISNAVAWWLDRLRRQRIAEKSSRLAKPSDIKTPVTIVTGFLGSGKTTLINYILTSQDHGKRIAVIENEIGAISIDDKLLRENVQEKTASGIFVMKNGCICCSGTSGGSMELERVLNHIIELMEDNQYDYIIVETSGLADPAPVMQTFFSHQISRGRFFLDGVVTLVDSRHVWRHLQGGWSSRTPEVLRQIGHASLILINKTDTIRDGVDPPVEALRSELARINAEAEIFVTQQAAISLDRILDRRDFDAATIACATADSIMTNGSAHSASSSAEAAGRQQSSDDKSIPPSSAGLAQPPASASSSTQSPAHADTAHAPSEMRTRRPTGAASSPEAAVSHRRHRADVSSVSLASDRAVALPAFHEWITGLAESRSEDLYRTKGVLHAAGSDRVYVLQGVCGEMKGGHQRPWAPGEPRRSELVIIGRGLDPEALRRGFAACLCGAPAAGEGEVAAGRKVDGEEVGPGLIVQVSMEEEPKTRVCMFVLN